jgi:Homeodomain-like domain
MPVFPGTRPFRSVLRVDHGRWDQTVADLRHLALTAAHPRSRERVLALHEIAQGSCATAVAERTGRRAQTVMGWLHAYNEHGPEALTYQRTGGRPPFVPTSLPRLVIRSAPRNTKRPVRRSPEPR